MARPMKSAYELAMERLSKSDPGAGRPVSAEQKTRLAEIDRVYKGKVRRAASASARHHASSQFQSAAGEGEGRSHRRVAPIVSGCSPKPA